MSEEANLCAILLKQHFGEVVEQVGRYLIKGGSKSFRVIYRDVACSIAKVKKALLVLLHHNLAVFIYQSNGVVEYQMKRERVLLLLRYPRYIYDTKVLFGPTSELIITEVLINGRLQMSVLVQRLTEASDASPTDISEKFKELVSHHFLRRCQAPIPSSSDKPTSCPNLELSEDKAWLIPEVNLSLIELNSQSGNGTEEPPTKRVKSETPELSKNSQQPDFSIFWRVDYDRFHQLFRDQAIVKLTTTRVDEYAGNIVGAMLRHSETNTAYDASCTNPISRFEIVNLMRKETGQTTIDKKIDSYLAILLEDSTKVFTKYDERSGGMFSIDFNQALKVLTEANLTSMVQDRYGSKCCRIFRLLLMKKYLDQKQIEEMSMIPAKEAKEYTYKMIKESILVVKEIPQTPDFAPSRTFFLFYVDTEPLSRLFITWINKAAFSAINRHLFEIEQNKRLLQKENNNKLFIEKLISDGASEEQIQEVRNDITPPERELLQTLERINIKLNACQTQLDDTLFIIKSYIQSLIKFPPAPAEKKNK